MRRVKEKKMDEYILKESLKEYVEKNNDEKIIIWGTGKEARTVAETCGKNQIICFMDTKETGRYIGDIFVCDSALLTTISADCIIIADESEKALEIYRDINTICEIKKIKVLDVFGKPMKKYVQNIVQLVCDYGKLHQDSVLKKINENYIVAIDIDNTLFSVNYIKSYDFYKAIETELLKLYSGCNLFALKIAEYRSNNKYISLKNLVKQVIIDEHMGEVDWDTVWNIVYKEIEHNFAPRKAVVDILRYSVQNGKLVCLVEDMPDYRLDREFIEKLLTDYQIDGINAIICSTETGKDKISGIFEDIKLRYGDIPGIFVGNKAWVDLYMAQVYALEPVLIKNPYELFLCKEKLEDVSLENNIIRHNLEKFLEKFYQDKYALDEMSGGNEYRNALLKLKTICKFEENFQEAKSDVEFLDSLFLLSNPDAEPEKLVFNVFEQPEVSIIVPVYNQFEYTYNCLKAIMLNSSDIKYEVIVADDCSNDRVSELEKYTSGIKILHNTENLRFLLNCNNAAKYAKGKYIVFLNNDTQVQPNWLKAMVKLMDEHSDAGMVGAKLIYPNGCLQEAGGILWKDGSAWNYGHMKNPTDPEYCYVKEADYISGAAIMIRASLWNEIGGFDERFVPAYYEDTDLAFEVRKHGYKVFLQPASVVVHFEGISNGTDIFTGLKNYQVVNQKKFYEKWKDVLETEHFENGTNVYLAKDRGQTRKQILVVDHYVPNFDKDAGGRCTYMYMKAFLKLGMKVTFIGDNFAKPEPYTTILNQLGIEVLYGDYYCMHWKEWLKDNLKYFVFIYLQRPHISIKYMDLVKEYGRGKIFYFAHDLHHVRMYRDYLVSGNEDALKESEYWKKIEMELFEKTDVGHVVGSYEQEVMQKAFPDKPIRNIPLYIYDDEPDRIEKDFSRRKNILFVGGFKHAPNIDAVLWFAKEVFPQLLERYPELVWHIVGSSAPEEVKALASEHIVLEGFVTDEELGELYRRCRLVVVPLRYGAGVKGKIVESAYYQIPVVTTAIGGEGLDASIGSFVMEDDADKMAQLIEYLYTDYDELRKMSDAGETMIQKYFTSKAAEKVLLADMNL